VPLLAGNELAAVLQWMATLALAFLDETFEPGCPIGGDHGEVLCSPFVKSLHPRVQQATVNSSAVLRSSSQDEGGAFGTVTRSLDGYC
jgi:hypothetical protein